MTHGQRAFQSALLRKTEHGYHKKPPHRDSMQLAMRIDSILQGHGIALRCRLNPTLDSALLAYSAAVCLPMVFSISVNSAFCLSS